MNRRQFVTATAATAAALGHVEFTVAAAPPNVFGVQTHFAQGWPLSLLDQAKAAGLGLVRLRDEVHWHTVEPTRSNFDFSRYDAIFAKLAQLGLKATLVCMPSNAAYDPDQAANPGRPMLPNTAQERAAFARYVVAVLERYVARHPGLIEAVEVWNEVNGGFGGGYTPDTVVAPYVALLQAVHQAVRAVPAYSTVKVLGGAAVLVPINFFKAIADAGGLAFMDAVVVHPYGAADIMLVKVAALRRMLSAYGAVKPIWATEFGGTRDTALVARQLVACRASGFDRASFYLLRNDPGFDGGLLDASGAITPVGRVFRHMATLLGNATYNRRLSSEPRVYLHQFTTADSRRATVCWAEWGTADLNVTGSHRRAGIAGAAQTTATRYRLTQTPFIIMGAPTIAQNLRGEVVLADMLRDFSMTQGAAGWSYLGRAGGETYPLTKASNQWEDYWTDPDAWASYLSWEVCNPSARSGGPMLIVRRWQVPAGVAKVRIKGYVKQGSGGNGTDHWVYRNGTILFRHTALLNQTATFDQVTTVAAGDVIEFVTSPGANNDMNWDTAFWRATILSTSAQVTVPSIR